MRRRDRSIVLVLVGCCCALVGLRVMVLQRAGGGLLPERHFELILDMQLDGHGDDVVVEALLPLATSSQRITDELVTSGKFEFSLRREDMERRGVWSMNRADGHQNIVYSSRVRTRERRFEIADGIPIPADYPANLRGDLAASEQIQSDDREIRAALDRIVPAEDRGDVAGTLRRLFDFTHRQIRPAPYVGETDARTCLRLGDASCGGKSRLFVALARAAGIPARPVGGLILKEGSWSSSHVWAEAWVGGHWVPFCPLNGYFAQQPSHYMVSYLGDRAMFRHSTDVNFDHTYSARRVLTPPAEWREAAGGSDAWSVWAAFERVRIPVELLKVILMIPFGALVVVFCRNVLGIETFGTFMPALMAVAFDETGLGWGLALFFGIITVGAVVRFGLSWFQLLHTPRLAVILTATVFLLLGLTLAGAAGGSVLPTRVGLFPLAILTLTIERFAVMIEEDGPRRAGGVVLGTVVVVAACYAVMGFEPLQLVVLAMPETLLLVVAAQFVVGRFMGVRLLELFRFRALLTRESAS